MAVRHRLQSPFTVMFGLLFVAAILFLSFQGYITFTSWQQVVDLHNSNLSLSDLSDHPHFYRYLTALPGLFAEDYYGEGAFSVYISLIMILSLYFMYLLLRDQNPSVIILACTSVFTFHMFMNGRGAISWFGWMIVLFVISRNREYFNLRDLYYLLFALLCCSVSSGTFSVAFFVVCIQLLYMFARFFNFRYIAYLAIVVFSYGNLAIEGLNRNIGYYSLGTGNPILNMLDHGLGSIVRGQPFIVSLILSISIILFSIVVFSLKKKPKFYEYTIVIVPIVGGIFGITTLTLVLPSTILVVSRRINFNTSKV